MALVLATYLEDPKIKQSPQLFLQPACQRVHPMDKRVAIPSVPTCSTRPVLKSSLTKSLDCQVDQGAQSDAEHLAVLDDGSAVGASAKGTV